MASLGRAAPQQAWLPPCEHGVGLPWAARCRRYKKTFGSVGAGDKAHCCPGQLTAPFPCPPPGFAVFCAHAVMLPIDGCSINPARSLGPAIVSGTWPGSFWVFMWAAPHPMLRHRHRCRCCRFYLCLCCVDAAAAVMRSLTHCIGQCSRAQLVCAHAGLRARAPPSLPGCSVGPFSGAIFAVPFHLFFRSDWVGACWLAPPACQINQG